MDEIKLLQYQIKNLEKNLLKICDNLNTRLNDLENNIDSLYKELKNADNIKK